MNGRIATIATALVLLVGSTARAQSGLRESLEKLDRNQNGNIDPDEITPLARPYLERVARVRRMSLDRPNPVDRWQEAARIYYANKNGVQGKDVDPEGEAKLKGFTPQRDDALVPEFGIGEMKYPYTQDDLRFVARTMRSHDENKDGYIDRREAARHEWTHRNPFDDDLDNDGRLSRMEMVQRYARRRLLEGASGELVRKAWRTGNGIRSSRPEEQPREDSSRYWRRGGTRYYLTATILGRFDRNKNGRLEADETLKLGIPMGQIDADRNGELSRDELEAYFVDIQEQSGGADEAIPGWFYELDANRDQQVAMTEFTEEWSDEKLAEFTSLDINGDGLLTTQEVLRANAMVGGTYSNTDAEVLAPRKTIISEIDVPDDFLIGDLNVQLSITHTHTSHLDAFLTGPDGQRIELFTEVGAHDDHFEDTIFDDQSRYPIVKARPPFKGTFMPEGLVKRQPGLGHFNGKSIKGVWQLVIRGTRSDRFGMLHRWSLMVTPQGDLLDGKPPEPSEDGPQTVARVDTRDREREAKEQAARAESERREQLASRKSDKSSWQNVDWSFMQRDDEESMAMRVKMFEKYKSQIEKIQVNGKDLDPEIRQQKIESLRAKFFKKRK